MFTTRWGPRTYANVANNGSHPGIDQRSNSQREAMMEGDNLKRAAAAKKAFFRMRLDLEGSRKQMGKGNIISFLVNAGGQGSQTVGKKDINKILRCGGFVTSQVLGITINDYRPNQIEVLFKDEVDIDVLAVENRVKEQGMDVIVSKFDHIEKFLMIYGLPLSADVDLVKEKIKEAIKPFVKNILEVTPCVHRDEDGEDFFKGNYDGNWTVKVVPKQMKQVPNYIVVDSRAQVMAKAVYTKKVGDKLEMCQDCFSTDHFKRHPECEGPVKWSEYCQTFRNVWEKYSLEEDEEDEQADGLIAESGEERVEVSEGFGKAGNGERDYLNGIRA